jgi:hypothetical protein
MARRKPTARIEFVLFNIIYVDGAVTSNRKVPSSMLGGRAVGRFWCSARCAVLRVYSKT